MAKKIMAWSKCGIAIAKTPDTDTMPEELKSVGTIKDKSSSLEPSDGDVLEAKATGGETVAKETQEGGFTLKTRVIEPDDSLLEMLGLGEASKEEDFDVKTHVVDGEFAVKVTPKNVGAVGIKAPKTNVSYKPGWSEEEGHYADLEFEIIKSEQTGVWYKRFKKKAGDVINNLTGAVIKAAAEAISALSSPAKVATASSK